MVVLNWLMKTNKINILKEQKCSVGIITLRDDRVLTFKPFEGVTTVNLDDVKEMYSIFMELTKGVPHLYYSDNTNLKSLGREERIYVSTRIHNFASAMAIKENSAIVRFITHTMVHLTNPEISIKMFKTEESAINWLKS
jgi:hypothetical protein